MCRYCSQGKSKTEHTSSLKMFMIVQEQDAQKDLSGVISNIVKINNVIAKASQSRRATSSFDCPQSDLFLQPGYAQNLVDANVLDERSHLSESDIDILMLMGEGLSRQQISREVGWDTAKITKWLDDIVEKAHRTEPI